jgi:hypothetical protein
MLLFTPVTTGEPVSTVVLTVIAAVGSLFRLFGGGVSGDVKRALEGIRGTISQVADGLMRFAWQIARALGKVLQALHTIWVRVIWPVLRQLPRALGRLRRLIERDLPRLLKLIERIRARLLELYERWMRPLLVTIQRVRRMLVILRLFHVKWAERLDARLSRLQGQIMRPLAVALEHIALVEQWLNVVVNAEQLIQETIFGRSVYHYQDPLVRSTLGAFTRPMDPLEKLELWPRAAAVPAGQSTEHLRLYLRQGTGPVAEDVAHALAELRRL